MVAYDTRLATFERTSMDATSNHRLWLPTQGASIQCMKLVDAIHNLYITGQVELSRADANYITGALKNRRPDEYTSLSEYIGMNSDPLRPIFCPKCRSSWSLKDQPLDGNCTNCFGE